jgi:hypothetical protein
MELRDRTMATPIVRGSLGAEDAAEAGWPYRTGQALGLMRGPGGKEHPAGHAATLEKSAGGKMINWLRLIQFYSWWLGLS